MAPRALKIFLQLTAVSAALTACFGFTSGSISTYQKLFDQTPAEVTPMFTRTWGTWTAIVAAIRWVAASQLDNGRLYFLAWFTLAVAGFFWTSECLVYGSVSWESAWFPMVIDGGAFLYMTYVWIGGLEGSAAGALYSRMEWCNQDRN